MLPRLKTRRRGGEGGEKERKERISRNRIKQKRTIKPTPLLSSTSSQVVGTLHNSTPRTHHRETGGKGREKEARSSPSRNLVKPCFFHASTFDRSIEIIGIIDSIPDSFDDDDTISKLSSNTCVEFLYIYLKILPFYFLSFRSLFLSRVSKERPRLDRTAHGFVTQVFP